MIGCGSAVGIGCCLGSGRSSSLTQLTVFFFNVVLDLLDLLLVEGKKLELAFDVGFGVCHLLLRDWKAGDEELKGFLGLFQFHLNLELKGSDDAEPFSGRLPAIPDDEFGL